MLNDVISANYMGEYKIELMFEDGATGVIDFSKYLSKGGVFKKFKDIEFFKDFKINEELGVLTWGDEVDIAPETLYAEATNSSLPDWMDSNGKQNSSANISLHSTPCREALDNE
ncbi:MAG: DUF2442 domain-containing protein [Desulfohalobiaceae bacterium]|nr:DUF2442 domain-containing protein [Desulfohalobiaceae bacterium]